MFCFDISLCDCVRAKKTLIAPKRLDINGKKRANRFGVYQWVYERIENDTLE